MNPLETEAADRAWESALMTAEKPAAGPTIRAASIPDELTSPGACYTAPVHYEPNYRYPLIVWLHAHGENAGQLRRVMPQISLRNFVGAAPCGTTAVDSAVRSSFTWGSEDDAVAQATAQVRQAIDSASGRYRVHPDRVFLVGDGLGGSTALRIALQHPTLFAGAVSLGGPVPSNLRLTGPIEQIRALPLLLAQGRDSGPETTVCEHLRLLHSSGIPVTVRHYTGSYSTTPAVLADLNRWLMARVCGG